MESIRLAAAGLLLAHALAGQQRVDLAIANATVIDPQSRRVHVEHTILISGDRVTDVVASVDADQQLVATTVDGSGLFVIPGLLDMHVHLTLEALDSDPQPTLDLLVANGVTGVRDMASDCWEPREKGRLCADDLRRLAAQIDAGERAGPRILSLASAIVRGPLERGSLPEGAPGFMAPQTAEEGRELARYLKGRGIDLIKVYNSVPRDAYFGLHDEARRLDLEVSGHLPLGVSVQTAARARHRTIEHARDLPVACSSYGAVYRDIMHRVIIGDSSADPPDAETRLRETLRSYDDKLCRRVLKTLKRRGTYLVPTHGTREMDARAGDAAYREDARRRYLTVPLRQRWDRDLDNTAEVAPRLGPLYREFYELGIRLTGMAHRAGVRVMAGTDANDTMIFPGFGLHDELERFAQAGISAMDILRSATTVPADYLDRSDDLGGIGVGKLADLVVLRANPLDGIGAVREIEAVVLGGRLWPRSMLDQMLQRVETEVAASSP